MTPNVETPVRARITACTTAPTVHAPGPEIHYRATLMLPEGDMLDVPITRPKVEAWGRTIHVWPLKIGTVIDGKRIGTGHIAPAEYSWEYAEEPLYRRCDGTEVPRST